MILAQHRKKVAKNNPRQPAATSQKSSRSLLFNASASQIGRSGFSKFLLNLSAKTAEKARP